MVLKLNFPCGKETTLATGEWSTRREGARRRTYQVRRGATHFSLNRQVPQEEAQAQGQGMMEVMQSKEWKALDARFNAADGEGAGVHQGPQARWRPA